MGATVDAVTVTETSALPERRPLGVVEPTILVTLAAASLYFFGALAYDGYYTALGVPWDVRCSPYDCLVVGSEVAAVAAVLVLPFALAWLALRRTQARLVLENLPYMGTGIFLLLVAFVAFAPTVDLVQRLLGVVCGAGGAALLLAGARRVKEGRSWLAEARRRDPKALAAAALGLFLVQFAAAVYLADHYVETAQRGRTDGFGFTHTPVVFLMEDPASPLHGREVRVLGYEDGLFYVHDPAGACPHVRGGDGCILVVRGDEVASVQVAAAWD